MDLFFDQPIFTENDRLDPFALTDVFIEYAGEAQRNILHFWECDRYFILGMKDTRVDDFSKGVQSIYKNNYLPVIRNSGGLGVICDLGVLNVSMIFPKDELETIDHAYEKMFDLVAKIFPNLTVEAYEISNSYCPGRFDLSVDGKKIAGISQRRVKEGIAVMMYLGVNGPQKKRGDIVKEFYQASLRDNFGKNGYPPIESSSMVTLSEVIGETISIETIKTKIKQRLKITTQAFDPYPWIKENELQAKFAKKQANMIERNQKLEEALHDNTL